MKPFFCIFFLFFCVKIFAQTDSINPVETTVVQKPKLPIVAIKKATVKIDSTKKVAKDTLAKADSLMIKDSLAIVQFVIDSLRKDSLAKANAILALPKTDTSTYAHILGIPYLPFGAMPMFMIEKTHQPQSKDELFYILAGTLALLAAIKMIFPKYFNNIFGTFFQTSLKQKQTIDQLTQNSLASLLMNLLFVASGGIYAALVMQHKGWVSIGFWWLILYCASILAIVYFIKFLFIQFSGWVFNNTAAAKTYIFVVFLSNKIVGILLIPFLLVLSFSGEAIVQVALTISVFLLGAMLLYRYIVSMATFKQELSVNGVHFFIYLCTVEILPLLLIYKAAFNYVGTSF